MVTSQTCEISCVTGEAQLCASDGECGGGEVCRGLVLPGDGATSSTGVCSMPPPEGGRGGGDAARRDAATRG
jgi:hypothetical protein